MLEFLMRILQKLNIFIFILVFSLNFLLISNVKSSTNDENVEELLDKLEFSQSKIEAENIRKELWQYWIYNVPDNLLTNLDYALNEFYAGRLLSAEKAFTDLINKEPNYVEGWNKRATIRYMINNLDGSLSDIEKVLDLQPRHFGAISGSGLIYIKKKKYTKALKIYKFLNKIDPMNTENVKLMIFVNKMIKGNSI